MKKYLFQILIFSFMLALVLSVLSAIFEKLATSSTDVSPYSDINGISDLENIDADLLVLGNSRADMGYDDSLMTCLSGMKCLNLGRHGYSFDYEYHIIYENYIQRNKKPEYIIVDVSPWVFFDYVKPIYNIQMLPYINRPEFEFYIELCPQLSNANKVLFIKYFGKMGKVMKEIHRLKQPEKPKNKKEDTTRWSKDYFGKPMQLECTIPNIEQFVQFLDECKTQNVRVIIVCSPMHINDGSKYFDMDGFWNIVMWCNKDAQFPMVTYQDLFGNDTLYFSDPAHLNKYGKQRFTTKLMHDLDSVGIIKL